MKTCFKCNIEKPFTEFYKHSGMVDGFLNKCKSCTKKDATNHRNKNIEKAREYDKKRSKNKSRIALASAITKLWRAEDFRRSKAHNAVARAIKSGDLVRLNCFRCGSEKTVAHHEDYDKPLDVVWLCQPCHKQRHQEINLLLRSKP